MYSINQISLYGLFFGMLGTILGGFIGSYLNFNSKKYLSFILQFAAGLMNAIICFDLIPESILSSSLLLSIAGILLGIFLMYIINLVIINNLKNISPIFKTSLIIFIGLTLHNLPEGLAIGAGFTKDEILGFSLAISIMLHDIPEGISISSPLSSSGFSKIKSFLLASISGITTGIGAFIGATISNINETFIGFSLSIAAGSMLYIITYELLPESYKLYSGKSSNLAYILGTILGMFIFI